MTGTLILASGSAIRARILKGAGVPFEIVPPDVDEDAVKKDCAADGLTLEETAMRLADTKALAIRAVGRLVLGSDQILAVGERGFDKPRSIDEARARLRLLAGREHRLINAVSIAKDGDIVFRHLDAPRLTMRAMSDGEIDRYLAAAGEEILASVGAYQVEAFGARLFERIDGDYFAVLGLSLFPALGHLRKEGMLAF